MDGRTGPEPGGAPAPPRFGPTLLVDGLLVGIVASLPSAISIGGLGLYSDDWAFLATVGAAPDHGFLGALRALAPELLARPPQLLALAVLFGPFDGSPVVGHVAETLVLAAGAVLFYFVLRGLAIERGIALAAGLVFAALPHYSTDRFWITTVQAPLALALFGLACLACVAVSRATRLRIAWAALGALSIAAAGLSYEVFIPLAALPALALVIEGRFASLRARVGRSLLVVSVPTVLVVAYKVAVSTRIPEFASVEARLRWIAFVLREGTILGFGTYGIGLPATAVVAALRWPDWGRLALSLAVAAVTAALVFRAGKTAVGQWPKYLALGGALAFFLGLAIFATNYAFLATPTGNDNRVMIAATLGVALVLVGGPAWIAQRLAAGWAVRSVVAAVTGIAVGSGLLINLTIASFWVAASQRQDEIVDLLRTSAPPLPSGSTVLLDGVCPYAGPGIVFEAPWDLAGRLRLMYGDPTLRADVVTPRLTIRADGITTETYGAATLYPYTGLLVFDARRQAWSAIADADAARQYLDRWDPDLGAGCGESRPGAGAPIL